jgi:hypothetical protein
MYSDQNMQRDKAEAWKCLIARRVNRYTAGGWLILDQ